MGYELKPCPFCGRDAKTEITAMNQGIDTVLNAVVYCPACGCAKSVKFTNRLDSFEDFIKNLDAAVEMWNRRA